MRPASSLAILVFIIIVAVGAVLTYAMYGISASWGSNWLSIAALVVATVVAFAIKVAGIEPSCCASAASTRCGDLGCS